MKYAMFSLGFDPAPRLGLLRGDSMLDLKTATARIWPDAPTTLLELIQRGPDAWARMAEIGTDAIAAHGHLASSVRWHAPIPRPTKNVFCLGLNYVAHAKESSQARGREMKIPTVPVIFSKSPTTVTGPYDDVAVDRAATQQVDWEVELGVVIGKTGRNIAKADALGQVFGYTVINDLSARDLQQQHVQWFKGKSLDGFCSDADVRSRAREHGGLRRLGR